MPFVGKRKSTGERLDLTLIEDPWTEIQAGDTVCPYCGADMYIRSRLGISVHFVHKSACTSPMARNAGPESALHLACKRLIAEYLREEHHGAGRIEVEHQIPQVSRIADVAMIFNSGYKLIHEIQLSPISPADLQARTDDYWAAGYDVVWWLGQRALTKANRLWSLETYGAFYAIDIEANGYKETLIHKGV